MLYFAYGSNNQGQLEERVGHPVTRLGMATLPNHKFVYQGRAVKRRCATANVQYSINVVYGILFDGLTEADLEKLDGFEGVKFTDDGKPDGRYMRVTRKVDLGGESMEAELYILTGKLKVDQELRPPSRDYVTDVLRGAFEAGYPSDYIRDFLLPQVFGDVVTVDPPVEFAEA